MKTKQAGKLARMNVKLFLILLLTVFCSMLFGGITSDIVMAKAAVTQTETPSGLKAAAGNGKAQLTWNAVTGAKKYAVYMKKTSGEAVLVDSGVTSNSYTVPGLANGTKVGFVVKAYANGGWSGWSSVVWVTPQAESVPPKTIRTVPGDGQVRVSWDAVDGAQVYALFLKRANGEVVLIHNRITENSYTVAGLANGTTVGFVVKSYVSRQWSGWSTVAWTIPQQEVTEPKNVTATAGNGKAELSWNEVKGAVKYALYMKKADGTVVLVDSGVKTNSYTVAGLANGIDVGFILKAYVAGKWSNWSNTVWVTPIAPEETFSPRITYVDDNVVISQGISYGNGYLYVPESQGAQETYERMFQLLFQYSNGVTTSAIVTQEEMLWIAGQLIQMQGVTRIELEETTRYPSCSEYKVSIHASPAFIYLYALKNSDTSILNDEERLALAKAVELVKEAERFATDYEKEVFFHDYLVLNLEYNGEDPSNSGQTPYCALILQKCVCAGYASTFQLLLNMSGIDAMYVVGTGNGEAHAWNKVELDGKWYNVDVTWDDPIPDRPGEVRYTYLNVTDEYLGQNHSWNKKGLPECTSTKDNYILKTSKVCKTQSEANAYCAEQLALGENTVSFLFAGGDCSVSDIVNNVYRGCSWKCDDVIGGKYYEITFR